MLPVLTTWLLSDDINLLHLILLLSLLRNNALFLLLRCLTCCCITSYSVPCGCLSLLEYDVLNLDRVLLLAQLRVNVTLTKL